MRNGSKGSSFRGVVALLVVAAWPPSGAFAEESGGGGAGAEADGRGERTLVVPGPEGLLGTYRILATRAGPMAPEEEAGLGVFCEETEAGCRGRRQLAVDDDGSFDLSRVVRGPAKTLYLGARLETDRATTVHLLVSVRGELSVQLDGVEVLRHSSSRHRHDDALARLELSPGDHALVLRFFRSEPGSFRGRLRWLDERFRPGAGDVRISVGHFDDEEEQSAAARAVHFDEVHRLGESGPEARMEAWLPAGGVLRPVAVKLGGEHLLAPDKGLHGARVEHLVPIPKRGRLDVVAEVEGRRRRLGQMAAMDRRVLEAQALLEEALREAPEASKAPIAWRIEEMQRVVAEGDGDGGWRNLLIRQARRLSKAVAAGEDPYESPRGYHRMGFFSRLDGTAQHYELFVPRGYRHGGTKQWPLVITLHGFKGNAGDYFRNTFGLARDYSGGETLLGHGRHGESPRSGPMIVIAPTGRGQAMYRHAGEMDVLEALEDARRRFRVDPDRIYITGGSMGGTGAAYIPYRHPDLFAASAALAGYHDQRVRRDTDHDALSQLERYLQAVRSDIDWAENGQHMHTLLIRGTRDWPLEWTRRLVRRLEELGYPHEHREPTAGHNVWTMTYDRGAIFRYFARYERPSAPSKIHFRTARARTRRSHWLAIDERAAPDEFGDVLAEVGEDQVIVVRTKGVRALTLTPPAELVEEGPVQAVVDGTELSGPRPLSLHRTEEGDWELAPHEYPLPGHKRSGASGPIRDVYHEPLLFVVGTADPDHTLINRLVAEHWANPKGWQVAYRIVDDVDVTEEMIRDHSLVLVGPPSSNRLTARWADDLPISIDHEGIGVGSRCYSGLQVGTAFVAPSPEAPDHSLLILAGQTPLGTWRTIFLPDILPDFVVFDEGVAPARGQWAAGGTGGAYLEAGLFGMDWSAPETPYE